jgi:hypothetical protein
MAVKHKHNLQEFNRALMKCPTGGARRETESQTKLHVALLLKIKNSVNSGSRDSLN